MIVCPALWGLPEEGMRYMKATPLSFFFFCVIWGVGGAHRATSEWETATATHRHPFLDFYRRLSWGILDPPKAPTVWKMLENVRKCLKRMDLFRKNNKKQLEMLMFFVCVV